MKFIYLLTIFFASFVNANQSETASSDSYNQCVQACVAENEKPGAELRQCIAQCKLKHLNVQASFQSTTNKLQCDNQMQVAAATSKAAKIADQAATLHVSFGDLDIKKQGSAFNVYQLQECFNQSHSWQGIALQFKVKAGKKSEKTKTYSCITKQKRYLTYNEKWSPWFNVLSQCRLGKNAPTNDRNSPGDGSNNENNSDENPREDNGGANEITDNLYDKDFYKRTPNYGPDAVDDGQSSPSRDSDEDGDLLN